MKVISWGTNAIADLEEIYDYYSSKSSLVASKIYNSIIDEVTRLSQWPEMGKHEEFIEEKRYEYPFRSMVIKNGLFKIIYFITDNTVFIARIWSCRKDPNNFTI